MKRIVQKHDFSKKYVISYMLVAALLFLLICLLTKPAVSISGARTGLMLWATRLLPSLLPFLILVQLLIHSGSLDLLVEKLHISYAYFVLIAGMFFGFPMGCKLTVDLYALGKLNKKEAALLFIISNQMSPAFVGGYILTETLKEPKLIPVSYLILYLPSLLFGVVYLHFFATKQFCPSLRPDKIKKSTSGLRFDVTILDAGIMNSFETMLKLGGYIMLFSVLTALCNYYLANMPFLLTFIAGLLEITGAVSILNQNILQMPFKYIAILAATSFGGLSGIAQTASFLHHQKQPSPFSMSAYFLGRLLLAFITAILAAVYVC